MSQPTPPPQPPSRHARELAGGIANILGKNAVPLDRISPVDASMETGVRSDETDLEQGGGPPMRVPPPPTVPPTRDPTGEEAARLLPTYKELLRLSREQLRTTARRLVKLTERDDQMPDGRIIDYEVTNLSEAAAQYVAHVAEYDRLWSIYNRSDAQPLG